MVFIFLFFFASARKAAEVPEAGQPLKGEPVATSYAVVPRLALRRGQEQGQEANSSSAWICDLFSLVELPCSVCPGERGLRAEFQPTEAEPLRKQARGV